MSNTSNGHSSTVNGDYVNIASSTYITVDDGVYNGSNNYYITVNDSYNNTLEK